MRTHFRPSRSFLSTAVLQKCRHRPLPPLPPPPPPPPSPRPAPDSRFSFVQLLSFVVQYILHMIVLQSTSAFCQLGLANFLSFVLSWVGLSALLRSAEPISLRTLESFARVRWRSIVYCTHLRVTQKKLPLLRKSGTLRRVQITSHFLHSTSVRTQYSTVSDH